MTPILYDQNEQDFTTLGLGALGECVSCSVHQVLDGVYELEMRYPTSGKRYPDLKLSRIIKAVSEYKGSEQLFDIYKITKPMNGIVTVYATHVSGRRQFIPIMPCSAGSASAALIAIEQNVAQPSPFTLYTDMSTVANFSLTTPASLGQVLGGMEGSLLDVYRGEYEFDNFTIKMLAHRGQDNSVSLRYGKNITDFEQEESIASTITGICPFWADTEGNTVTLPEKIVESPNAANFPFKRTITQDFSGAWQEAPTVEQLRTRAQAYVNQSGVGIPEVGMTISYENLADYEEGYALLEEVRLGDTVHVYFDPLDVTASARVTEYTYDVILDKYQKVRIGSVKSNLSQTINEIETTTKQEIKDNRSVLEKAFAEALDKFSGIEGGNIIVRRNPLTGKPYEILAMDTDDISTAVNVTRINYQGIGISNNGINGPYTLALVAGEGLVATAITTGILNAIDIYGSTINGSSLYAGRIITLHAADYSQADVTRLQNIMRGSITPTQADYEHLDVDKNGVFNIVDVAYITNMLIYGNDITIDTRLAVDGDAPSNEIIKVGYTKIGYRSVTAEEYNGGSFNGAGINLDDGGTILINGSSATNTTYISGGNFVFNGTNHGLSFDNTNGLLYDGKAPSSCTLLHSRIGTGYTSTYGGNLSQYQYFALCACRGQGKGVMDTTIIPLEIARNCNSDSVCSWVYSAQNGTYSGQCYFNFSNNYVYLAGSSNSDNQVRLYGVR